jgi:Tfp pilus assembly protein PilZ
LNESRAGVKTLINPKIKVIVKLSDTLLNNRFDNLDTDSISDMSTQHNPIKRYNIIISKLFQIIINLGEEQQLALLRHAEELLVTEKRVNIRKSCNIPINFAAYDRVYSDHIKNISSNGLFIETRRPLLVGDEIIMTFRMEGFDKPLKVKGEIAHATRAGVGVEFREISKYIEEMLCLVIKRME